MGNFIDSAASSASRQLTPVQEAQNDLFRRYQLESTVATMQAEVSRWDYADGTIADMPLEEQAVYADFVTRNMCDPNGEYRDLWPDYLADCLSSLKDVPPNSLSGSCNIGNIALVISRMPDGAEKDEAKALLSIRVRKAPVA